MSNASTDLNDHDVIAGVVQHYIDGARSGKGDDMKPAFHEGASIFGYIFLLSKRQREIEAEIDDLKDLVQKGG